MRVANVLTMFPKNSDTSKLENWRPSSAEGLLQAGTSKKPESPPHSVCPGVK